MLDVEEFFGVLGGFFVYLCWGDVAEFGDVFGEFFDVGWFIALTPLGLGREVWAVCFEDVEFGWALGCYFAKFFVFWVSDCAVEGYAYPLLPEFFGNILIFGEAVEDAVEVLVFL